MTVNISWAFVGNAVYAGCQWVVFILLVRRLPLNDVGEFAYWIALTGPLFVLANVRLRNLAATGADSPHGFPDYFRARLMTSAIAVCLVLVLGLLFSTRAASLVGVVLIGIAKACDALSDICHGLFQRELDMRSAAVGLMLNGVLSVILVAATLMLWPSLPLAVGAYAAASMLALFGWDLPRMRTFEPSPVVSGTTLSSLRAAVAVIRRAAPLGLSSTVGSLQTNVPRYVVAAYLGPASLAVFTALAYLPALGSLIANAVAQAALPVLARDLRESGVKYGRRLRRLVQLGVSLGTASVLAVIVAGRGFLSTIYGKELAEHADVLIGVMTAAALTYAFVFLGTAATARMRFGAQLLISSMGLLVASCSLIPLVSRYGLPGAAYALCAAAFVEGCAYIALTAYDFRHDARLRIEEDAALAAACDR